MPDTFLGTGDTTDKNPCPTDYPEQWGEKKVKAETGSRESRKRIAV